MQFESIGFRRGEKMLREKEYERDNGKEEMGLLGGRHILVLSCLFRLLGTVMNSLIYYFF